MSERPVNLQLGVSPRSAGLPEDADQSGGDKQSNRDVDPQLARRFAQAMAQGTGAASRPPADAAKPRSVFDLFAQSAQARTASEAGSAPAADSPTADSATAAQLNPRSVLDPQQSAVLASGAAAAAASAATSAQGAFSAASELIDRLLVSDGSEGRRQVRMNLADESLPEVSVSVYEDSGAWVADFECGVEASYQRLVDPARVMAERIASELGQDAVWSVRAPVLGLPDVLERASCTPPPVNADAAIATKAS